MISKGSAIDRIPHQLKHVEAKAATAAKEGNTEYYFCRICSGYFADDTASHEIEFKDTVTDKLKPSITEGNNASVDASAAVAAIFRSDAAYSDFIRVAVDGRQLVENKEFSAREGSIIITLTPEFIKGLSAGRHTLEIVSASGTAATDFTVISGGSQQETTAAPQETTTAPQETTTKESQEPAAAAQKPTAKEPQETTAASQETTTASIAPYSAGDISSPDTGDSSHAGVWIVIAVIFAFFIWLILTLKSAQDHNYK